MKLCVIFALLGVIPCLESSRILMILSLGSRSHKNIFTPLATSLAEKGHHVSLVTLHRSASSDNSTLPYEEFAAEQAWDNIKKVTGSFDVFKMKQKSGNVNSQIMKKVFKYMPEYCSMFLRDPSVQKAWETKPDLIMLPAFMNECGLALVHKFKVPFIYVTTSGLTPWTADLIGNPEHPAYVPSQYTSYSDEMTIMQKTVNTLVRVFSPIIRRYIVLNRLDGVVQRFLKDPTVSLEAIDRNVSVVLVNSHFSLSYPRPLLPNAIEVGGMHCREAKPLSDLDPELDSFMNTGEPVILFSLGSTIRSNQLPKNVYRMFVGAFSRLPFKIIWKWEGEVPKDLPKNIITRPWLPQQDILGHPAVKAFLTHGGLLSVQEAIYHGVPIVAMPLMSDQDLNSKQVVEMGLGKLLQLDTLSEDQIYNTLISVVTERNYGNALQRRSLLMKDQETTPLNRALYWTEYVIRHGGAEHLKSSALKLSFAQYYLLDVIAVIFCTLVVICLIVFISYKIAKRTLIISFRIAMKPIAKLIHEHRH